jgi:DNA-binding NarL/FixJ family response regulator
MKIHVIDNIGQIQPHFLTAETDVSFFSDEVQAINAAESDLPGLILLGYALRGAESAAFIDLLLSLCPLAAVVLVGEDLSDQQVLDCLLVGAKGYLNSRDLPNYLDKLIKVIPLGEAWITRRMTARLLEAIRLQNTLAENKAANTC